MISIYCDPTGTVQLTQRMTSPAVYLDMWALMEIAGDKRLAERFNKALLRRDGTLLLSWFHLLEFNKPKSPNTATDAEQFLGSLDWHVAFLEPLPDLVIEAENRLLSQETSGLVQAPHLDNGLLRLLHMNAKPPAVYGFEGLLRAVQDEEFDDLARRFDEGMSDTSRNLNLVRERRRSEPAYERQLRLPLSGPKLEAATRYVVRETVRDLIRDDRTRMSTNDWKDFAHMVVSVSYADLVVLDKSWADRAGRVRTRLQSAGLLTQFAKVYAKASFEAFWTEFDV